MLTIYGVYMRIDDSENYIYSRFTCKPTGLNFKAQMEVGTNFTGQISQLYVNFVKRKLNLVELQEVMDV